MQPSGPGLLCYNSKGIICGETALPAIKRFSRTYIQQHTTYVPAMACKPPAKRPPEMAPAIADRPTWGAICSCVVVVVDKVFVVVATTRACACCCGERRECCTLLWNKEPGAIRLVVAGGAKASVNGVVVMSANAIRQ